MWAYVKAGGAGGVCPDKHGSREQDDSWEEKIFLSLLIFLSFIFIYILLTAESSGCKE